MEQRHEFFNYFHSGSHGLAKDKASEKISILAEPRAGTGAKAWLKAPRLRPHITENFFRGHVLTEVGNASGWCLAKIYNEARAAILFPLKVENVNVICGKPTKIDTEWASAFVDLKAKVCNVWIERAL